jgi:hypothetical protein
VVKLASVPAPESIVWERPEAASYNATWSVNLVSNVSEPTLTVYLPPAEKANGTALIIAPRRRISYPQYG